MIVFVSRARAAPNHPQPPPTTRAGGASLFILGSRKGQARPGGEMRGERAVKGKNIWGVPYG